MEVNILGVIAAIMIVIFLIFMMPYFSYYLSQILIFFQGNTIASILTIFAVLIFIFLGILALTVKVE